MKFEKTLPYVAAKPPFFGLARAEVGEREGLAKLGLLKESVEDRLDEAAGEELLNCTIMS